MGQAGSELNGHRLRLVGKIGSGIRLFPDACLEPGLGERAIQVSSELPSVTFLSQKSAVTPHVGRSDGHPHLAEDLINDVVRLCTRRLCFSRRRESARFGPETPSRGDQDERDEYGDEHPDDVRVDANRFALLQGKQVDPVAEEPDGRDGVGIEEDVRAEPRDGDRLLARLRACGRS